MTPVYLEFIAGVRSQFELTLAEAFLNEFEQIDQGEITRADCQEALRIARRVPRDGRPRQLGDCLIRALANRFRREVDTLDQGFPR